MSEKTIFQKMFLKSGMKVFFGNIPADLKDLYTEMPEGLIRINQPEPQLDVINLFVKNQQELEREIRGLRELLKPSGIIWLCYPKLTSKLKSDLNRDTIYPYCLKLGYQTVSMISINETWSAMKMKLV